jgi:hypothetical protein
MFIRSSVMVHSLLDDLSCLSKQYTHTHTKYIKIVTRDTANKYTYRYVNLFITNSVASYTFRPPTVAIYKEVFLNDILHGASNSLQI